MAQTGPGRFGAIASPWSFATILLAAAAIASPASAAVKVSSGATQNMSCSGGVCAPTETDAVLNAGDLENMLASGNATVTTTGNGVEANNLIIAAPLSWSALSTLALEAHKQLRIERPVSVAGSGGLALSADSKSGSGTELSFGPHGNASFANLSSKLTIENLSYTLIGTIAALARDIAKSPSGHFALAADYNAKHDGTYKSSPVPTPFNGIFEGLGNTISRLTIYDSNSNDLYVGLFAQVVTAGKTLAQLRDIGLVEANVTGVAGQFVGNSVGALLGDNSGGNIRGCYSTGAVAGTGGIGGVGGLAGANGISTSRIRGLILDSHSTATVAATYNGALIAAGGLVSGNSGLIHSSYASGAVTVSNAQITDANMAGGLVGEQNDAGGISESFATGAVTIGNGNGGNFNSAGGLVGYRQGHSNGKRQKAGSIINSYATGAVSGGADVNVGGLIGASAYALASADSYSTGLLTAGDGSFVGGFVGLDYLQTSTFTDVYWDTDSSGITKLNQGAGNIANDPGITGLSTAQLQSGLPQGFNPKIWAQNSGINNGLPYLKNTPPSK